VSTQPTPDQKNLAAALECLRLLLEAQSHMAAMEEPPTPMQKLWALWGLK
jgi:hypothetical protein